MNTGNQNGFSLLEVLVALVVLAIGMLGLAGMQMNAMRDTQEAHQRSAVSFLLENVADRMRANPAAVANGSYDNFASTGEGPECDNACVPADMADHDAFQWGQAIAAALPGGQGRVVRNNDGTFTATVMWDADRTGAAGTDCDPGDAGDMKCFSVTFQP